MDQGHQARTKVYKLVVCTYDDDSLNRGKMRGDMNKYYLMSLIVHNVQEKKSLHDEGEARAKCEDGRDEDAKQAEGRLHHGEAGRVVGANRLGTVASRLRDRRRCRTI